MKARSWYDKDFPRESVVAPASEGCPRNSGALPRASPEGPSPSTADGTARRSHSAPRIESAASDEASHPTRRTDKQAERGQADMLEPTASTPLELDRALADRPIARGSDAPAAESALKSASVGGVILAGTQSWGGCALEQAAPRPLVPVANQPLIAYALRWMAAGGIRQVNICGSQASGMIRRRLTPETLRTYAAGALRVDHYEDIAPRGPAGCVRDAGLDSGHDTLVVVDGSIIPQLSLKDLLEQHQHCGAALTVAVLQSPAADGDEPEPLVPLGIYVFERRALGHVLPTGYQDIKEALVPRLYRLGEPVVIHRTRTPTPRVTGVDTYLAVNGWVLAQREATEPFLGGHRRTGETAVHESATVEGSARLVGPVLIGPNTRIGRDVTIVGPTSIGEHCVIEGGSVVTRSAIWDRSRVQSGSVLDRCILTCRADVPPESVYRYVIFAETRRQWTRRANGNGDRRAWGGP